MNVQDRKLIFINLLNDVNADDICKAFNVTKQQIKDIYNLIIERIKLARFKSQMPFMKLDTIDDAKKNRLELIQLVDDLEQYLNIVPKVKIVTQPYMGA